MPRVVTVRNLATGEQQTFTCTPEQAVVATYAQERGDYATWEYEERYASVAQVGQRHVSAGDWSAALY